jgi:hypothetical protein
VPHEAAAGPEGYARATRPDLTNLLTSVTNSFLDRTPVLAGSAALATGEINIR